MAKPEWQGEYTYQEISETLGINVKEVQSIERTALRKIAFALRHTDVVEEGYNFWSKRGIA